MGADLIVDLSCDAKLTLGDGDQLRGTITIMRMRKSRSQAMAVAAQLQASGAALDQARVTIVVQTPEGREERQVSVAELLSHSAPLQDHADACPTCPANATNQPYGCLGHLPYPITPAAEAWLIDRVQPPGSLGHALVCRMLEDFGYSGEHFATWRERGLLTAPEPQRLVLRDGEPPLTISTDQIFHALFAVGDRLDPTHCALVLLWLGALAIDGAVGATADPTPLITMRELDTVELRQARSALVVGPSSDDHGVAAMQLTLGMLWFAWVNDVSLLVDA